MAAHDPPAEGTPPPLRFHELSKTEFEDLTTRYCNAVLGWNNARRWGEDGEKQDGLDTIDDDGRCAQAKRRRDFGPKMLRDAVELWDSQRPAHATDLTITLSRTPSVQMLKELRTLQEQGFPVEVLGADRIGSDLRFVPAVVAEFFSESWAKRYCDPVDFAIYQREAEGVNKSVDQEGEIALKILGRLLATGVSDEALGDTMKILRNHTETMLPSTLEPGVVAVSGEAGSGKSSLLDRIALMWLANGNADPVYQLDLRDSHFDVRSLTPGGVATIDHADSLSIPDQRLLLGQCRAAAREVDVSVFIAGLASEVLDDGVERLPVRPLAPPIAQDLISAASGQSIWLSSFDESIRAALVWPLYALLAAALLRSGDNNERMPASSKLGFVHRFCSRALEAADPEAQEALTDLAVSLIAQASVEWRGRFNPSQLTAMQRTRLVEIGERYARFRLPLFESEFVALAILKDTPTMARQILENDDRYVRWRKSLALALAFSPEETVALVFEMAVELRSVALMDLPQLASDIASLAIEIPETMDIQAALRSALGMVLESVGTVGSVLTISPDFLHVRKDNRHLSVALVHPGFPAAIDQLDSGVSLLGPLEAGIRSVRTLKFEPVDHLWPWRLSLELLAGELQTQKVFTEVPFPVEQASVLWPERRYAIARSLADRRGLRFDPIQRDSIRHWFAGQDWERSPDFRDVQSFVRVDNGRDIQLLECRMQELRAFHQEILSTETESLKRPWVAPDQEGNGWIDSLWSRDGWLQLTNEVYEAALDGYEELVDQWFQPLSNTLPLSAIMPVRFEGLLRVPTAEDENQIVTMTSRFVPTAAANSAKIEHESESVPDWAHFGQFNEREYLSSYEFVRTRNPSLTFPHRLSSLQKTGFVRGRGDRDAQQQALKWLVEDLRTIGIPLDQFLT